MSFLWPCFLAIANTGQVGLVCAFYVQKHRKAQPAVLLVLKHLKRRNHCFKSHPTDWEKLTDKKKEYLAIRRIFSLVDMITNTKFLNCPNVFKIDVVQQ